MAPEDVPRPAPPAPPSNPAPAPPVESTQTPPSTPDTATSPDPAPPVDNWENIGYHRVLGGFFFNIAFALLAVGYMLVLPLFVPFPESMGYYNILTGIFSSIFTFADFGLASALSKFVAEYRVKDPARTIQYVRFFIWFQAFTGLVQTTVISLVGLYALRDHHLAFMAWMFCWLSTIQYPGWLGVFNEALKGFQQYGKQAIVGLLNTIVFQTITLIIGAQLGAYLGQLNPRFGAILGSSIGLVVGYYVDDFTSVVIAGWLFSRVLAPLGFRVRDVFTPHVPKEVARESLRFGLGVMAFVLSYQSIGTILAFVYARYLPNYGTLVGTLTVLSPVIGLAETVNGMHIGNHRATVSEAYFNDKPNYAAYVLSNAFRTIGQITFLILPVVLIVGPPIVTNFFPEYAQIFFQILVWRLVFSSIFQHSHVMNEVLIGTGHHKFNVAITVGEQLVLLTTTLVCLQYQLGIFVLIIPGYFQTAFKQGVGWVYINRRIIDLHFNPWQSWGATGIAGAGYYLLITGVYRGLDALLTPVLTPIGTIALTIVLAIYVLPGPGYFLTIGLLGGYDDHTLADLERAVALAGPSKIIVRQWYRMAAVGARSPLHGKFPMYTTGVDEEIRDLMAQKAAADARLDAAKPTSGDPPEAPRGAR